MFSFRKKNIQAKKRSKETKPELEIEWKAIYSWLLLVTVVLGGVGYLTQKNTWLPIKTIKLSGSFQYIDQKEVEAVLLPYVGEGFFSLDIHAVRQALSDKPWTDSVSIRRVWPGQLSINMIEKTPVARWDEKRLISDRAIVYLADTKDFQQLPLVHAENDQPVDLLRQYYSMQRRFSALNERITALRQDSRGAIEIELADGLKIKLGRDQVEHKIERLITVYQREILPRRSDIKQLDLRYSNGFAVAWKKEALENRNQAAAGSQKNV
ncbi:MAG: FtsQ-type POTRA domain-containing protein [Gammaproteobacteria bacterium]|nr:FtsQ-type POTRA domain-containing protein [Gammaproteobacteria bacterium]